jgi:hypothetical protein
MLTRPAVVEGQAVMAGQMIGGQFRFRFVGLGRLQWPSMPRGRPA